MICSTSSPHTCQSVSGLNLHPVAVCLDINVQKAVNSQVNIFPYMSFYIIIDMSSPLKVYSACMSHRFPRLGEMQLLLQPNVSGRFISGMI